MLCWQRLGEFVCRDNFQSSLFKGLLWGMKTLRTCAVTLSCCWVKYSRQQEVRGAWASKTGCLQYRSNIILLQIFVLQMNTESSCSLTLYYFQECVFIERLHLCKFIQKAGECREPGHIIGSQKEASSVSYSVYTTSSFCWGVAL